MLTVLHVSATLRLRILLRSSCFITASALLAGSALAQETAPALDQMLAESHRIIAQATQGDEALGQALQAGQSSTGLPNGASSITETFSDWTVNCEVRDDQKLCAMSQTQGDSRTGQQIFAVELYGDETGNGSGILVLPFGLDVQKPVSLNLGDESLGENLAFTTCMPVGCLVPLAFSKAELDALKAGTTASVIAHSASPGREPAEFVISLSGFTAATNRVAQLSR